MENRRLFNSRQKARVAWNLSLNSKTLIFAWQALCCFVVLAFFAPVDLALYAAEEEQTSPVDQQEESDALEYSRPGWTDQQRKNYRLMLERGGTTVKTLRSLEELDKKDWESSDRLMSKYGFQIEYARSINYTHLLRDPLPIYNGFFGDMLEKLGKGEYEFVIEETRKAINESVEKNPPWDAILPPDIEKQADLRLIEMLGNQGCGFSCLVRLLALALELNGEYDKAQIAYGLAYGADAESMAWIVARLNYERGLRGVAFLQVCEVVQEYHNDLKPADIDKVIDQVKTYEGLVREGRYLDTRSSGIPIGRDENHNQDVAMMELYQIRRQLALFINPFLDYSELAYCRDQYRQERENAAKHIVEIRNAYAKGVAFIEEEFKKEVEQSDSNAQLYWVRQHQKETTELLRKMKELPY